MTGDMSGDLTGRRLGNYRIDGVLGKGGMSVMYKATDVRLGRKVALKVIGEHLGTDAEFRERFVDEARNTSAIDHANVVPLYDFGELDGMLYIAMRMVDGADLASLIGAGPMTPERALGLLDQVADALDTLHHRGLVHLDVKPANVLVTSRESAREHVYVADFGLTRRGATGHRTRGGDFLGSPTYAAPEHLRGEPLDGRTDQYALTCVLYACLTGSPPFSGDVPTVIKGHLGGEPPVVSRSIGLPPAIDEVIRKGMARSPQDRYPSCGELISAARRALLPETGKAAGGVTQAPVDAAAATTAQMPPVPPQGEGARMQPFGGQQPPGSPGFGHQGQPGQGQPGQQSQPGQRPGQQGPALGYQRPQGPPPSPPHGMPPQQSPYGPPQGLGTPPSGGAQPSFAPYRPPVSGDPVRLRPPAPASGSAFNQDDRGVRRWLVPVLIGVIAIGLVVGAILLFTGSSGDETTTPTTSSTPAPQIPVGSDGPSPTSGASSSRPAPPTSIPVEPGAGG